MSPQDRSFGRRTPAHGTTPRPTPAPAPESPDAGEPGTLGQLLNSRGGRQIAGIALGIALTVGLVTVYVSGMKMAGRALDRQWADNAGYPSLDNPPASRTGVGGTYNEIRTACKARSDQVQLSRAMDRDLDYYVNIRVGELQVEQHAAFIDCLMTTMQARFCRAEHRAHLADAIRTYFRLRMRVREEWMMARTNPFSAQASGLMPMPGSQGITTRYPSEHTDPRIIAGLSALITNGYLTRAELGAGAVSRMPGDLDERLKGVERKKRSCG